MQEVLDELDMIECFEQKGCTLHIGEVTKKQKSLYSGLDIDSPTLK